MKYYRDVDYFIYFEEFPHMGISGVIVSNSDGTVNIFINTLYSFQRQQDTIRHELRHLARQHQYCDWMTIEEKELEADDLNDPSYIFDDDFSSVEYIELPKSTRAGVNAPKKSNLPDIFAEAPPETIPVFASLDVFRNYMFAMREQYQREVLQEY